MLWVRIPAPDTGWTFSTIICCKIWIVYLKKTDNKWKRRRGWPIFNIGIFVRELVSMSVAKKQFRNTKPSAKMFYSIDGPNVFMLEPRATSFRCKATTATTTAAATATTTTTTAKWRKCDRNKQQLLFFVFLLFSFSSGFCYMSSRLCDDCLLTHV